MIPPADQGAVSEVEQRAEALKAIIRKYSAGGCRMLSRGDACECPLCLVDGLLALVAELRQPQAPNAPLVHVPRSDEEPARITIPYAEYLDLSALRQQQEQQRRDHEANGRFADSLLERAEAAEASLTALRGRVNAWRSWAQFVYKNGGPAEGTDNEMRWAVCEAHDSEVTALRREQEQVHSGTCEGCGVWADPIYRICETCRTRLVAAEATGAAAVSQLREENARLKAEAHIAYNDMANWRRRADTLVRERQGEVWLWQGDDEDHPESLGCPVLMQPDDVRQFVAAEQQLADQSAALAQIVQEMRARSSYWRKAHGTHSPFANQLDKIADTLDALLISGSVKPHQTQEQEKR